MSACTTAAAAPHTTLSTHMHYDWRQQTASLPFHQLRIALSACINSKMTGSNSSKLAFPPTRPALATCIYSEMSGSKLEQRIALPTSSALPFQHAFKAKCQQQQQACLSTNTPCLDLTVPSASSRSLILHGPISHWHVRAVTQAFSWQAN